jgi:hypothetical protein
VPDWAPHSLLAAAAVIALVSTLVAVAAAAEQQDQNDDPAHIPTTEAVVTTIITHTDTSNFLMRLSMPLIPWYSAAPNWCGIFKLSIFVDKLLGVSVLPFVTFSANVYKVHHRKKGILCKPPNC